ncbi:hypothetical protein KMT30_07980 [Streptomyces sp. IBSBF 2953]|nr:hypothetical protein [Streptomyces hayashii]
MRAFRQQFPPSLHEAGLGWHQLVCALCDLHGPDRHLVKETNLFFAADTVPGLLPRSPAIVLGPRRDRVVVRARSASEPKLSLALTAYSRAHPVDVVTTTQPMTDLGLDTGDL